MSGDVCYSFNSLTMLWLFMIILLQSMLSRFITLHLVLIINFSPSEQYLRSMVVGRWKDEITATSLNLSLFDYTWSGPLCIISGKMYFVHHLCLYQSSYCTHCGAAVSALFSLVVLLIMLSEVACCLIVWPNKEEEEEEEEELFKRLTIQLAHHCRSSVKFVGNIKVSFIRQEPKASWSISS